MGFQLDVRSPKSRHRLEPLEALGEDPPLSLPVSGGPRHSLACGHITPVSASVSTWPSPLCGSLPNSLCLPLIRIYVIVCRL